MQSDLGGSFKTKLRPMRREISREMKRHMTGIAELLVITRNTVHCIIERQCVTVYGVGRLTSEQFL